MRDWRTYLKPLLTLGRVSNLPTVWSNCMAGWILGGAGGLGGLALLVLASSLVYLGGMFLNDAFDADFDRSFRPERPIPSRQISEGAVWAWGIGLMGAGTGLLCLFGPDTKVLALLLAACVLAYDRFHKGVVFSPFIMAGCRVLLFLTAASVGEEEVPGLAIWSAFALGGYIVGLSYIAKTEANLGKLRAWPALFLLAPLLLALMANAGDYRPKVVFFGLIYAAWVFNACGHTFWATSRNPGLTVSRLLAGIALVDLLAIGGGRFWEAAAMLACFGLAHLAQRHIPAT